MWISKFEFISGFSIDVLYFLIFSTNIALFSVANLDPIYVKFMCQLMLLFQYIYNEWTINSSWTWYLYFRKLIGRFRRLQKEVKLSAWIHSSIPFCLKFYHVSQRNKWSVWMHSIVPFSLKFQGGKLSVWMHIFVPFWLKFTTYHKEKNCQYERTVSFRSV